MAVNGGNWTLMANKNLTIGLLLRLCNQIGLKKEVVFNTFFKWLGIGWASLKNKKRKHL